MEIKTILVVDDSDLVRTNIQDTIRLVGHNTLEAADGHKALQIFKQNASQISLIFCDVNMPKMNGLEFIQEIRLTQEGANVPVIILSSEVSEKAKTEGKKLGVKGWVSKPYKRETLEAILKQFL